MLKFSQITEDVERQLKAVKADHDYVKQHGYEHVGKDKAEDYSRHRYSGKSLKHGNDTYHGHLQFHHNQQGHTHSQIETHFTKMTDVSPIHQKREVIDKRDHKTVKSAVDHLNKLYDIHNKND